MGIRQIGKATDSESVICRFEPYIPNKAVKRDKYRPLRVGILFFIVKISNMNL
jgi:hypothetical protein